MSTSAAQSASVEVIQLDFGTANAINGELLTFLDESLSRFESSDAAAAVLTGHDRFFSAGLNLIQLYEFDRPAMEELIEQFKSTVLRLFKCPKPVVAAINGHAVAGGCILALACDYRIMGRGDSLIGLNELKHGLPLPSVALEVVRTALPPQSLPIVLYQGLSVPPQKALSLHLINELVESTAVQRRARTIAGEFGQQPASAFSRIKRDLRAVALERIQANDNTAEFIDIWFSDETRRRIGALCESLLARKQVREEAAQETATTESDEATEQTSALDETNESIEDHGDHSDDEQAEPSAKESDEAVDEHHSPSEAPEES